MVSVEQGGVAWWSRTISFRISRYMRIQVEWSLKLQGSWLYISQCTNCTVKKVCKKLRIKIWTVLCRTRGSTMVRQNYFFSDQQAHVNQSEVELEITRHTFSHHNGSIILKNLCIGCRGGSNDSTQHTHTHIQTKETPAQTTTNPLLGFQI